MPSEIFLVTLGAVEDEASPPLTVLAFARAEDDAGASAAAIAELEALGWRDIVVLRTGVLVDRGALPDDFRGAVDTAERFGCGLIIYDEP